MKQSPITILRKKQLTNDFYELTFDWSDFEAPRPGQFLTLRISEQYTPLLRRPFAFAAYMADSREARIIFQVRGKSTHILANVSRGQSLDCIGPLGNFFPAPEPQTTSILLAGGIGLGPILFLARQLYTLGHNFSFIFGCRTRALIPDVFSNLNAVICTDDGSFGFKGTVADYLKTINPFGQGVLYSCGPVPMIKAVNDFAVKANLFHFVSMEQVMACSMGACLGCVISTKEGFSRVCTEGPIYNGLELVWETKA